MRPPKTRLVLATAEFWRKDVEAGGGNDQAAEITDLPIQRAPANTRSETSGTMARRRVAGGGLGSHRPLATEGKRSQKGSLAEVLWKYTTVSQEWLAEELQMRSAANVSQLLRRGRGERRLVPRALTNFVAEAVKGTN